MSYLNSDLLVMYFCVDCEEEEYFSLDSLPGGEEHCEYCEHCGGKLVPEDKAMTQPEKSYADDFSATFRTER